MPWIPPASHCGGCAAGKATPMNADERRSNLPSILASKMRSFRAMLRLQALRPVLAALLLAAVYACTAPEAVKRDPIPLPQGNWELVSATFAERGRVPGAARATV